MPIRPGTPVRQDYEYVRGGTCNLFVAVEPKGGRRTVLVTDRRAKPDFVVFVQYLLNTVYTKARRVHLVMDNLNTHLRKCFEEVLGLKAAKALLRRVVFHYTPKHASWLNRAEIEIGILDRQCLIAACQTAPHWLPRSTLGNSGAMQTSAVSRGRSLGRMQIRKWLNIMFRN